MKPLAMTEDNFNAVIRGDKTETRRLLTLKEMTQEFTNRIKVVFEDTDEFVAYSPDEPNLRFALTPRLQIGDRAYLKEPTQVLCTNPEDSTNIESCNVAYFWGDKLTTYEGISDRRWVDLAEGDSEKLCNRKTGIYSKQGAMFMLKSFARHSVEILDVRVERLLDITDEGAINEGVKHNEYFNQFYDYRDNTYSFKDPVNSYLSEIEMLHGKEIAAANPWLWVYKFKYLTGDDNA